MNRLLIPLLCLGVFIVLQPQFALAGTDPCPAVGDNAAGTCNIIITIAANGSITTTAGAATQPYDNVLKGGAGEDVTVGVINNSSTTITQLTITGAPTGGDLGPFDFDEASALDDPCDPTLGSVVGSVQWSGCPKGLTAGNAFPFGPTGYESSTNISFSNFSSLTTGTVNFMNGILGPGDNTWFALEAPAGLNLKVTTAPESSSMTLLLVVMVLGGVAATRRRRTA